METNLIKDDLGMGEMIELLDKKRVTSILPNKAKHVSAPNNAKIVWPKLVWEFSGQITS